MVSQHLEDKKRTNYIPAGIPRAHTKYPKPPNGWGCTEFFSHSGWLSTFIKNVTSPSLLLAIELVAALNNHPTILVNSAASHPAQRIVVVTNMRKGKASPHSVFCPSSPQPTMCQTFIAHTSHHHHRLRYNALTCWLFD